MRWLTALLLAVTACGGDESLGTCEFATAADSVEAPSIHTPRWAFEPWISKDISDGADTRAFVQGFKERDIPVGVVVIDSPWETHYNSFVPNEERYPNFAEMVSDLRADGVRTVLWVTQMVNQSSLDLEDGGDTYKGPSPGFQKARDCGFLVDRGTTYFWWKGFGAGLDFFNPEAVGWWHSQQDDLYEMGIAGWKLDFGEQYLPPVIETAQGMTDRQDYSEEYYRDFYAYGASKLGTDEFVTMVRPYDKSYQFEGRFYARPEHAPVAWVGDQRRDWIGLSDALDHLFRSAEAGYVVIGSDIGGYLDLDDVNQTEPVPFSTETFARWTALGALMPFMQLHGRANLTPWTVPEQTERVVALYRYWSHLHSELVPFFYSLAEAAYAGAAPIVRPLGEQGTWVGDYRYMLGDAFLVAPILDGTAVRAVELPAGTWHSWWDTGAEPESGGKVLAGQSFPAWEQIPLYLKAGAIVPMNVKSAVTGMGTAGHAGKLTIVVVPDEEASSFTLYDEDGGTIALSATPHEVGFQLGASRLSQDAVFRVWTRAVSQVSVAGQLAAEVATQGQLDAATASSWWFDDDNRWLYIYTPKSSAATAIIVALAGTIPG